MWMGYLIGGKLLHRYALPGQVRLIEGSGMKYSAIVHR